MEEEVGRNRVVQSPQAGDHKVGVSSQGRVEVELGDGSRLEGVGQLPDAHTSCGQGGWMECRRECQNMC